MFSPLNDPQTEEWFQQFNRSLKGLPAAERVGLHEEVRQHLNALVVANTELGSSPDEAWELALTQFGDPTEIGRRLRREAQTLPSDPNYWAENPIAAACVYAFVQCAGTLMAGTALMLLAVGALLLVAPGLPVNDPWSVGLRDGFIGAAGAAPVWAGWITGRRMNREAVRGTLCGLTGLAGPGAIVSLCSHDAPFALTLLGWTGAGCLAAWLAAGRKGSCGRGRTSPAERTV